MLQGKTALVTGGSRGIGRAIARALYDNGARVYINSRSRDDLIRAAAEMDVRKTGGILPLPFDVAVPDACRQAVRQIEADGKGLRILVNCAGINLRGPLEAMPEQTWDQVLNVNLKSMFILAQAAFPLLRAEGGKIINIASLMSELARPNIAAYAASKGGVRQLTRAMAVEWAQYDIQANAIAPGYIETELNAPLIQDEDFNRFVVNRTPAKKWGKPEDIAAMAVFLASPGSDFVTGQIIGVDGGILASL
jgi:gluconate 5-dehydrogenase